MGKELTIEQKAQIEVLRESGKSHADVARLLSIPYQSAYTAAKRIALRGHIQNAKRPGAPRKVTERAKNVLVRNATKDRASRRVPLGELASNMATPVSKQTVRRILKERDLKREWETIKCKLTEQKAAARLEWANAHKNWTEDQWLKVCWSDESSISRYADSGRTHVTRSTSEKFDKDCVMEEGTSERISVMVWGCFAGRNRGPLHMFTGTTRATDYIEVLQEHLPAFMEAHELTTFMQDNSRVHTANIIREWLSEQRFMIFRWPATSPDLNPIEHVWRRLKELFGKRYPDLRYSTRGPVAVKSMIRDVLPSLWQEIEPDFLEALATSMPRRIQAVIKANGWYTKY